jgi:hypothetical protein
MAGQHLPEGGPHAVQLRLLQLVLRVGRSVAPGQQHDVALAQREAELLGEPHDHRRRRARAAGLDEAQMAHRDVGPDGQVELAQPAPLPLLPEQLADGPLGPESGRPGHRGHVPKLAACPRRGDYLPVKGSA